MNCHASTISLVKEKQSALKKVQPAAEMETSMPEEKKLIDLNAKV
jgi:hypothetical protein